MKKIFFPSTDGIKLCGIWHFPQQKTKKAVILVHGITVDKNESGNVFVHLADRLCAAQYTVFRFDFRGSGESGGKSTDMTIKGEVKDLTTAVEYVRKSGYSEIGLVGASFGGGIVILYASGNQNKPRCICLWNPVLNYGHCFLHPHLPWLRDKISGMKRHLQEKGWTELGSRKFKVGRKLFEEMERMFPFKKLKQMKIPLTILHGRQDAHVPYDDSRRYVKGVGTLVTFENVGHGLSDTEKDQEQAIQETLSFFNRYL